MLPQVAISTILLILSAPGTKLLGKASLMVTNATFSSQQFPLRQEGCFKKFASKVLPACSMLLLTLATRACLAVGELSAGQLLEPDVNSSLVGSKAKEPLMMSSNPNGLSVLNPLAPQWQLLTEPGAWLEATIQVKNLF